jgi:group I intron endonuclease
MYFEIPLEHKNSSGIYSITNTINGKRLIGSTTNFRKRFIKYLGHLKNNTQNSPHIQNSYNKHGTNAFKIELINLCNEENLLEFEDYYIMAFNTMDDKYGYNLKTASRIICSPETRKRMSDSHKGKKQNKEQIENFIKARIGMKYDLSTEQRTKISERSIRINTGRKHTEESKCKMRLSKKEWYCPWLFKKIYQYTKDNKLVQIFSSLKEAALYFQKQRGIRLHICCNSIGRAARNDHADCGFHKTAYGFKWSYNLLEGD